MLILSECILKRECAILTKEEDVEFWKKLVGGSPHNSMRVRFFEAGITKVGGYTGRWVQWYSGTLVGVTVCSVTVYNTAGQH